MNLRLLGGGGLIRVLGEPAWRANFFFFFVADSEITSHHGKRCYLTFAS